MLRVTKSNTIIPRQNGHTIGRPSRFTILARRKQEKSDRLRLLHQLPIKLSPCFTHSGTSYFPPPPVAISPSPLPRRKNNTKSPFELSREYVRWRKRTWHLIKDGGRNYASDLCFERETHVSGMVAGQWIRFVGGQLTVMIRVLCVVKRYTTNGVKCAHGVEA